MWKVKRMNTARIVDVTIANGVDGIAAFLAGGSNSQPAAPLQVMQRSIRPAVTASGSFINQRSEGIRAVRYGVAGRPAVQTRPRGQMI
jgi:hypothetical protein